MTTSTAAQETQALTPAQIIAALTPEQQKGAASLATYHCNLARREGDCSIVDTKLGCLEFGYENGTYTLTKRGSFPDFVPTVLAQGKPAKVKPVLMSIYSVG
jgi:hypothetical protein